MSRCSQTQVEFRKLKGKLIIIIIITIIVVVVVKARRTTRGLNVLRPKQSLSEVTEVSPGVRVRSIYAGRSLSFPRAATLSPAWTWKLTRTDQARSGYSQDPRGRYKRLQGVW